MIIFVLKLANLWCLFSGFVPANREIWVIGDQQMTLVAQHLDYWKECAQKNPHDTIHMLRWYDVKAFPSQSASTNAVEVVLYSLIGALNTRPKLPQIIVVMLGDVKFWCESQALKFTMDSILMILLREIKRIVEARQQDLPVKAVGPDPAIFFVKLLWKPEKAIDSVSGYPQKRHTFNKLLDSIVRPRGANTITLHEINDRCDEDLFLTHGNLSEKGYRQIWKSLSEAIGDFEQIGKQKRKVFAPLDKHRVTNFEVDSSIVSSEEEFLQEPTRQDTPQIQNKRRFNRNKNRNTHNRSGHASDMTRGATNFGQSFFQQKF